MRDDDPSNYAARSHERLLEIRGYLSRIEWLLGVLVLVVVIWFIWSVHRN
ncbi:MAG TPA: hypothetical protein VFN26_08345 [Candidatus Acidoferrum sp.]|nr:hypothetical protein [Candidatus Acidoferrum sp.]